MRTRALIVDDERLARVALRGLLEDHGGVEVVGEADSVAAARQRIAELHPDLIFLDVQMPGGAGFELFQDKLEAKVIFCTAWEQYAVRAFEVNALDYLVKPIQPEHLDRALGRVAPLEAQRPLGLEDLVALRESQALRFASVRDITFIQAADDYSEVHLANEPTALVDVTLRRWEERLPTQDFVRIHRSSLVNLRHVHEVRHAHGRWEVVLRQGPTLAVSRRMASELRDRLRAR
ncbi:MAG: LytTR family DNA-binding domain-containing protein [Archangium sp.]|nr:LytTR family DNA-binding domain-containing protein [Archangium sp.]